jgi:hypothetical protein
MDYQQSQVALVAKRAESLNFDKLIDVFVSEDEPKSVYKHLTELYFAVVEHVGADDIFPYLVGSLYRLRLIIQAIESMDDLNEKQLAISVM